MTFNQARPRPLTDITWSADGRFLLSASSDGSVGFFLFDRDELGKPYTGPRRTLEPLPVVCVPKTPRRSAKPSIQSTPIQTKQKPTVSSVKKKAEPTKTPVERKPRSSKVSAKTAPAKEGTEVEKVPLRRSVRLSSQTAREEPEVEKAPPRRSLRLSMKAARLAG